VPQSSAVIEDFEYTLAGMQPTFVPTANRLYVTVQTGGPTEIRVYDQTGRGFGNGSFGAGFDNRAYSAAWWRCDFVRQCQLCRAVGPRYRYDPVSKKVTVTALRETSPYSFDGVDVTRELATSKDGTKVPLTILRRKGTKLNGKNPAVLTGYGGFELSMTPFFDPGLLPWLDAGGVFAIANLRGGGEFGEEWHQQGAQTHKQNVFDDFIGCAEYLITKGYTNPSRLGIQGGSNGGLLMGAVLTQRPDLFRAVVSGAGLYDMLRFEMTQNGQYNATEYGSVKDPEQFKALYAYSPYHHVESGVKYPAVLLTVGENDPRVDPWHSRKFAAALQAATASKYPVLLLSFSNAGHGGIGSSQDQQVSMAAYELEFLYDQLGREVGRAADIALGRYLRNRFVSGHGFTGCGKTRGEGEFR